MTTGHPLRKWSVIVTAHVPDLGAFRVEGDGWWRNRRDFRTVAEAPTAAEAIHLAVEDFTKTYPWLKLGSGFSAEVQE